MKRENQDPWFPYTQSNPSAQIRLFCFPYAGGNSLVFRNWIKYLGPDVEVLSLQMPGRGQRLYEPPFTRMELLIDALEPAIAKYLDKPIVFFGHSMGALISFELAHRLCKGRGPLEHLFVSGRRAPHLADRTKATFNLPQAEFVNELQRLRGTPVEILQNEETLNFMLPLIRSDFELVQTYEYTFRGPLPYSITAFGGMADVDIPKEDIEAWQQHSQGKFNFHMFPGDHFFLQHNEKMLLSLVARELNRIKNTKKILMGSIPSVPQ